MAMTADRLKDIKALYAVTGNRIFGELIEEVERLSEGIASWQEEEHMWIKNNIIWARELEGFEEKVKELNKIIATKQALVWEIHEFANNHVDTKLNCDIIDIINKY